MAAEDAGNRLPQLIDIARLLALELDANRIVERVVLTAKRTTRADGASVYLIENDGRSLALTLMLNDTLGIRRGGDFGEPVEIRPPPLFEPDGTPNRRSVVAHCVHSRRSVRLDDAYTAEGFDFAVARAFDKAHSYRSRSFLTVPMIDNSGHWIGGLQLINACTSDGTPGRFRAADQTFRSGLAT